MKFTGQGLCVTYVLLKPTFTRGVYYNLLHINASLEHWYFVKHDFDPNLRGILWFQWCTCKSETLRYHKFELNFPYRGISFNFSVPHFLTLMLILTPVQTECKNVIKSQFPNHISGGILHPLGTDAIYYMRLNTVVNQAFCI